MLPHPIIPQGLTIRQLGEDDIALGEQARTFCLAMITATYGTGYNPQWHTDLDSLTQGKDNQYTAQNRGCFLVVQNQEGQVVGTAGMRSLAWRKNLAEQFGSRYPDVSQVASQWRLYLAPQYRGQGLGRTLVLLRQSAAVQYGYKTLYLHSELRAVGLRKHWESLGFTNFLNDDVSAHFDKPLTALVSSQQTVS